MRTLQNFIGEFADQHEIVDSIYSDMQICHELRMSFVSKYPESTQLIDESFPMLLRPSMIKGEWAYRKFVIEQLGRVISGSDLNAPTNVEIFNVICGASQIAPIHGIQMLTALYLCAKNVFDKNIPLENDILIRLEQDASTGQLEFGERIIKGVARILQYRSHVNIQPVMKPQRLF